MSGFDGSSSTTRTPRGVHAERRRRVDDVRVTRVDGDRAHAAASERVLADGAAPRVAAVGRLVEADAVDAAAAARVPLTRADPDRVRVARVERDRADRVDLERAAQVLPRRRVGERVLRPPDSAAGGTDPHAAVAGP